MFKGDFQEGHAKEVTLKEISFDALQMLVEFIYTGKLNIDKCTFVQAIQTADYLPIECAIKNLNDYISKNITLDNCIEMYEASEFLRDDVGVQVESFIRRNLGVSSPIGNFLALNIEHLEPILIYLTITSKLALSRSTNPIFLFYLCELYIWYFIKRRGADQRKGT